MSGERVDGRKEPAASKEGGMAAAEVFGDPPLDEMPKMATIPMTKNARRTAARAVARHRRMKRTVDAIAAEQEAIRKAKHD